MGADAGLLRPPAQGLDSTVRRLASVFVLVVLAGLSGETGARAAGATDSVQPGTTRKIVLDERARAFRRSFRLHVPAGAEGGEPRPLVVALHGGLATAAVFERQTAFSQVADHAGFYVVYPNGLGIFSLLRHWNGGYCCAKALELDLDDPAFIDRVIDWVTERHAVDRQRIYVVGYSNGGMLAHWYAATRADRLAGVAIWASSIGSLDTPERSWTWPPPAVPLPAMIAHGIDDPRLPWDAGARDGQTLLGAVGSAEAWAEAVGCAEPPVEERDRDGAVLRRTWCAEGASPVVLLGLEGWGHDWPGPKRTDRLDASDALHGYHLAEEIWRFFNSGDPLGRNARAELESPGSVQLGDSLCYATC